MPKNLSQSNLIAHARGSIVLPEKKIKVAGVLKELKANKNEKRLQKDFLKLYTTWTLIKRKQNLRSI